MSRKRRYLTSELEKIIRLLLLIHVTNAQSEGIFSALKYIKTYQLHALMLIHVHKNILDNTNLASVANEFADRKESRKQNPDTFLRIVHNNIDIRLS